MSSLDRTSSNLPRRARTVALPALPSSVARLIAALNKQNVTADEVARVVESDPGLSARLLRLANAPAYGFPRRIRTVGHAVALLGTVVVRGLAVGGAVFDKAGDTRALWAHSYAVGVVARHLAGKRSDAEDAFTSGLLHDVGSALLGVQNPQQARAINEEAQSRGVHVSIVEREVLGCDHADVGASLLQEWSLPQTVVQAVAFHHRPAMAAALSMHASLVHVADFVVCAVGHGSGHAGPPPVRPEAWLQLGIDVKGLDALKAEVLTMMQGLPAFD